MTRSESGSRISTEYSDRGSLRTHLTNLYGEVIFQKTTYFTNLRHKISLLLTTLTFLCRCRDHKIVPKFLRMKSHISSSSSKRILHQASLALLRERIHHTRKTLHFTSQKLFHLHLELSNTLNPDDWSLLDRISYQQSEKTYQLKSETHQKKFSALTPPPLPKKSIPDTVVNLSSYTPNQAEISLLSKGLNFAIAPKKIPTEEIISSVESAIRSLPKVTSDNIRFQTTKCLMSAKPPKSNISKDEAQALKRLQSNPNILILPADKGNATVLLDKTLYISKMQDLLQDQSSYIQMQRDPTPRIEREITAAIKDSDIPSEFHKSLIPKNSVHPRIYGLPKIHKQNAPLRPIVNTINSPIYKLSSYLANIFKDFTGKTPSHILNSKHFITKLSTLSVDPSDILVSFDVTSLFTKVPIPDSLAVLSDLLAKDNLSSSLVHLAEKCLTSTYFSFLDIPYRQISGTPMGSPLSPVIANIFMEAFESLALDSADLKPKVWFRYVDDTFIIWPHGQQTLPLFLQHINSQHPNIQFTMEIESNRSLPFLDVLVTRKPNGTLGHSVYRKPTHTDRYLNASSHHHPVQKTSVINSLIHRAISISEPDNLQTELLHLKTSLAANGYKPSDIQRSIGKQLMPRSESQNLQAITETTTTTAFLPYVQSVTDRIGKILRKEGIKTIFKPPKKVFQYLPSAKDSLPPLTSNGVYRIPCTCGKVYIGETGRSVGVRRKEHERCMKSGLISHSALAEHHHETGHTILFNETKVLSSAPYFYQRKIRESIEIRKHPENLNRDVGYYLSPIWNPAIKTPAITPPSSQPAQSQPATLPAHSCAI